MEPVSNLKGHFRIAYQLRVVILTISILCSSAAVAQDRLQLPEWLTTDERNRIEKEKGEKDSVEILMKIAIARLALARKNTTGQQYEQASAEIKNYGSLIAYTLSFIQSSKKKEEDKKDIYRKFELSLRRDIETLESLRFELPQLYSDEANKVYEKVRKAREAALATVFGKDFFPTKEETDEQKPF